MISHDEQPGHELPNITSLVGADLENNSPADAELAELGIAEKEADKTEGPTAGPMREAMEALEEEEIDPARMEEIIAETTVVVEETPTENPNLDVGNKLFNLFTARKNKIEDLTRRTELSAIEPLDYDTIDNRFYALAILQLGVRKMAGPIEQQRKTFDAKSAELDSTNFTDPDAVAVVKKNKQDIDDLNKKLGTAQTEMESLIKKIDNKQRWWAAQKAKERQTKSDIIAADTEGRDYTDWKNLPDRIIIELEEELDNRQPPLTHPLRSQEFYLNPKRTAEEFFTNLIKNPAKFFELLEKKETTYAVAATRLNQDNHSAQFTKAYTQFKMFVNRYVERFNNMLTLMGFKEEKLDYDYDPSYHGRAKDMEKMWLRLWGQDKDKILEYQTNLESGKETPGADVTLEQRDMS